MQAQPSRKSYEKRKKIVKKKTRRKVSSWKTRIYTTSTNGMRIVVGFYFGAILKDVATTTRSRAERSASSSRTKRLSRHFGSCSCRLATRLSLACLFFAEYKGGGEEILLRVHFIRRRVGGSLSSVSRAKLFSLLAHAGERKSFLFAFCASDLSKFNALLAKSIPSISYISLEHEAHSVSYISIYNSFVVCFLYLSLFLSSGQLPNPINFHNDVWLSATTLLFSLSDFFFFLSFLYFCTVWAFVFIDVTVICNMTVADRKIKT